jgi:hypothetical protein
MIIGLAGDAPALQSDFRRRTGRNTCVPIAIQRRLKYCTAFSCLFAAARVLNVPRFRRFPVFGFFFREYKR